MGCPRSGTTLLRVLLDSHPQFCAPDESLFLGDMAKIVGGYWGHLETFGLSREEVIHNIRSFFLSFHHRFCEITGKPRWVEKTPLYEKHLEFINELFPASKIIYMTRDGRDVAASHRENWGREGFFRALYQWPISIGMRERCRAVVGAGRFLEIRYENLVSEPRRELEKLMEFLEAEWDNGMLESHRKKHVTKISPGADRPMQPVTRKKVGSWKGRLAWYERALVDLAFRRRLVELEYVGAESVPGRWAEAAEKAGLVVGYLGSRLAILSLRLRKEGIY